MWHELPLMFSIKMDLNYGAILKFIIYHSYSRVHLKGLCNFAVKKKLWNSLELLEQLLLEQTDDTSLSAKNISALVFSELVTTSSSAT